MKGPARLAGIQALRGLAATLVVLSHSARHIDKAFGAQELVSPFGAGHAGVDLFFPISGFVILFVHAGDIGRPGLLRHYLRRRFDRVLPPYWIALALTTAMAALGTQGWPRLTDLLWWAALLPTRPQPLLGIAWTLQFELVFYAVFAVLVASRWVGVVVLAAWLVWIVTCACGFGDDAAPALCGIYGIEFFMGMAAAALVRHDLVPVPKLLAGGGLALFVAALAAESAGALNGFGIAARFAYGMPAALLVAGLAAAERDGWTAAPAWLKALGEASYSIYLFQFVWIGVVWQAWLKTRLDRLAPPWLCFLALVAAAIAGGFGMAWLVERRAPWVRRRQPVRVRAAPIPSESNDGPSAPAPATAAAA